MTRYVPKGVELHHRKGEVLMLKRALYGLKQAGRQWSIHLNETLRVCKWEQNPYEPCLFKRGSSQFILVYVDDILIVAPTLQEIETIKMELAATFPIKDIGELSEYLGIEIQRDRRNKTIYLRQYGSIKSVIERAIKTVRIHSVPKSPYADHI